MRTLRWILLLVLAALLGGCGYTTIQSLDEQSTAAWSEVLNQYQRRADLVPNLVNAFTGYVTGESEAVQRLTDARARVGTVQITPELLNSPDGLKDFEIAQGELSAALSRLLQVAENYPGLTADAAFRELKAQFEGNENRIAVARNRYIRAVQDYNIVVLSFPSNLTAMVFGYTPKPNFALGNEKPRATATHADFDRSPTARAPGGR